MKKMLSKIQNGILTTKNKVEIMAASATLAVASAMPQSVKAAGDPGDIVKGACEVVVKMFPFIGAFFVVAGVFKLILAYRNDQPEAQAGAAKDIVIGAVFIVFGAFVWDPISGLIF